MLGWYVPLELSDAYFTTASQRQQLHEFLRQLKQRMGKSELAISVFMSAKLPADEFGAWLGELQQLGYQVWLQDGAGTRALSEKQREEYFSHINCDVVMINEAFKQTNEQPLLPVRRVRKSSSGRLHGNPNVTNRFCFHCATCRKPQDCFI